MQYLIILFCDGLVRHIRVKLDEILHGVVEIKHKCSVCFSPNLAKYLTMWHCKIIFTLPLKVRNQLSAWFHMVGWLVTWWGKGVASPPTSIASAPSEPSIASLQNLAVRNKNQVFIHQAESQFSPFYLNSSMKSSLTKQAQAEGSLKDSMANGR